MRTGCACALAAIAVANSSVNAAQTKLVMASPVHASKSCSGLEREDLLPVPLHVHDGPALRLRLIQRLVEFSDLRLPVVGVFALGIGVMHDAGEAGAWSRGGPLQHLQIAVGIAEREDRAAADEAVDADRL